MHGMHNCAVCKHPERTKIEAALLTGQLDGQKIAMREIERRYGPSLSCQHRHKLFAAGGVALVRRRQHEMKARMLERVSDEVTAGIQAVSSIEAEMGVLIDRARKLLEACDVELRDPDDPEKYTLAHRAEDLEVVYFEQTNGHGPQRRKRNLQELLDAVAWGPTLDELIELAKDGGDLKAFVKAATRTRVRRFHDWRVRRPYPATLLLNTIGQLRDVLDFWARLEGRYADPEHGDPKTIQYSQINLIVENHYQNSNPNGGNP